VPHDDPIRLVLVLDEFPAVRTEDEAAWAVLARPGDLIDVTITRTSCPCDGTQIEFKLMSRNVIASQTAKLIASYEELIAKTKEQQIDNLMQIIKRESAALGVEPIVRPHRIKDVF